MSTIQDTDLLLVNRGDTDYKVKAVDLHEYFNPKMPWEGHDGGIWHIINVGPYEMRLYDPFTAWDIDGTNEREIYSVQPNEELVFITSPAPTGLFSGCGGFNIGPLTDTSKVIRMDSLFRDSFTVTDLTTGWDVSNVTSMMLMFDLSGNMNLNTSNWDTSKVRNMSGMFEECLGFSGDITKWDTSNVTNMGIMFSGSDDFNQDISGWDVSSVNYMEGMFGMASSFSQDLTGWCVTNIPSEPLGFKDLSGMPRDGSYDPKWGTCP